MQTGLLRVKPGKSKKDISAVIGVTTRRALHETNVCYLIAPGRNVSIAFAGIGRLEGLEMVKHYAQMVDDDLMQAHRQFSPVDNLSNGR